jgi:hypothetical protein
MIIKPAVYKKVRRVVDVRVSDERYGCDECRREIKYDGREAIRLDLTVHHNNAEAERLSFCSWKCVIKHIKKIKIKTDYFVSMPFLMFDTKKKGLRAEDFIALFK